MIYGTSCSGRCRSSYSRLNGSGCRVTQLKSNLERVIEAAAVQHDDHDEESSEELTPEGKLRSRARHAEASNRKLLAELNAARVEGERAYQTLLKETSQREAKLIGMAHAAEMDGASRIQVSS